MLLEFGAYNFASFKEGFEINLRKNKNSLDAYTVMGIKGANASGKTNVLKVLSFISTFCTISFNSEPDEKIPFYSFFDNEHETSIYAIFSEDNIEYKYEIDLTKDKVIKESIYRKDKLIIERIDDKITENTIGEFKELKAMILRNNVSIISTAKHYGIKSLNVIYMLFRNIQGNVSAFGLMDKILEHKTISMIYHQQPILLEFLKDQFSMRKLKNKCAAKCENKIQKQHNCAVNPIFNRSRVFGWCKFFLGFLAGNRKDSHGSTWR